MADKTAKWCSSCGRDRTEADVLNYSPMQVIMNEKIGWYSGDDGEICGECMTKLIRNQ